MKTIISPFHRRNSIRKLWKKSVAGLAALGFFVSSATAHAAEANFWQARRAAVQKSRVSTEPLRLAMAAPAPLPWSSPTPITGNLQISPSPSAWPPQLSRLWPVLSSYGVVRQAQTPRAARSGPTVIYIQDVHGQKSAQENIALLVLNTLKIHPQTVVGLEGGTGLVPVKEFRKSTPALNAEAGAFFLNSGIISGAEYAAFAAEKEPKMVGVEGPLYWDNIAAAQAALKSRPALAAQLSAQENALDALKDRVFTPALKKMDIMSRAYAAGRLSLTDYADYLAQALPGKISPAFSLFLSTLQIERTLNFKAVESQRNAVLNRLAGSLTENALASLWQAGLAFQSGSLSYPSFYQTLQKTAEAAGVPLKQYPEFQRYIKYILQADAISPEKLFQEIAQRETALWTALCRTPAQRETADLARDFILLKKLSDLTLTTEEWRAYQKRLTAIHQWPARFGGMPEKANFTGVNLKVFEDFYSLAEARNADLVKNLLGQIPSQQGNSVALLVAGGFHTQGLLERLLHAGATVVTVSPKMTGALSGSTKDALNVFTREKTPLETLFAAPQISLSDPLATLAGQAPGALPAGARGRADVLSTLNGSLVQSLQYGQAATETAELVAVPPTAALPEKPLFTRDTRLPGAKNAAHRVGVYSKGQNWAQKTMGLISAGALLIWAAMMWRESTVSFSFFTPISATTGVLIVPLLAWQSARTALGRRALLAGLIAFSLSMGASNKVNAHEITLTPDGQWRIEVTAWNEERPLENTLAKIVSDFYEKAMGAAAPQEWLDLALPEFRVANGLRPDGSQDDELQMGIFQIPFQYQRLGEFSPRPTEAPSVDPEVLNRTRKALEDSEEQRKILEKDLEDVRAANNSRREELEKTKEESRNLKDTSQSQTEQIDQLKNSLAEMRQRFYLGLGTAALLLAGLALSWIGFLRRRSTSGPHEDSITLPEAALADQIHSILVGERAAAGKHPPPLAHCQILAVLLMADNKDNLERARQEFFNYKRIHTNPDLVEILGSYIDRRRPLLTPFPEDPEKLKKSVDALREKLRTPPSRRPSPASHPFQGFTRYLLRHFFPMSPAAANATSQLRAIGVLTIDGGKDGAPVTVSHVWIDDEAVYRTYGEKIVRAYDDGDKRIQDWSDTCEYLAAYLSFEKQQNPDNFWPGANSTWQVRTRHVSDPGNAYFMVNQGDGTWTVDDDAANFHPFLRALINNHERHPLEIDAVMGDFRYYRWGLEHSGEALWEAQNMHRRWLKANPYFIMLNNFCLRDEETQRRAAANFILTHAPEVWRNLMAAPTTKPANLEPAQQVLEQLEFVSSLFLQPSSAKFIRELRTTQDPEHALNQFNDLYLHVFQLAGVIFRSGPPPDILINRLNIISSLASPTGRGHPFPIGNHDPIVNPNMKWEKIQPPADSGLAGHWSAFVNGYQPSIKICIAQMASHLRHNPAARAETFKYLKILLRGYPHLAPLIRELGAHDDGLANDALLFLHEVISELPEEQKDTALNIVFAASFSPDAVQKPLLLRKVNLLLKMLVNDESSRRLLLLITRNAATGYDSHVRMAGRQFLQQYAPATLEEVLRPPEPGADDSVHPETSAETNGQNQAAVRSEPQPIVVSDPALQEVAPNDSESLGTWLNRIRVLRKLYMTDLAGGTGLATLTIKDIEKDRALNSFYEKIDGFADGLGIPREIFHAWVFQTDGIPIPQDNTLLPVSSEHYRLARKASMLLSEAFLWGKTQAQDTVFIPEGYEVKAWEIMRDWSLHRSKELTVRSANSYLIGMDARFSWKGIDKNHLHKIDSERPGLIFWCAAPSRVKNSVNKFFVGPGYRLFWHTREYNLVVLDTPYGGRLIVQKVKDEIPFRVAFQPSEGSLSELSPEDFLAQAAPASLPADDDGLLDAKPSGLIRDLQDNLGPFGRTPWYRYFVGPAVENLGLFGLIIASPVILLRAPWDNQKLILRNTRSILRRSVWVGHRGMPAIVMWSFMYMVEFSGRTWSFSAHPATLLLISLIIWSVGYYDLSRYFVEKHEGIDRPMALRTVLWDAAPVLLAIFSQQTSFLALGLLLTIFTHGGTNRYYDTKSPLRRIEAETLRKLALASSLADTPEGHERFRDEDAVGMRKALQAAKDAVGSREEQLTSVLAQFDFTAQQRIRRILSEETLRTDIEIFIELLAHRSRFRDVMRSTARFRHAPREFDEDREGLEEILNAHQDMEKYIKIWAARGRLRDWLKSYFDLSGSQIAMVLMQWGPSSSKDLRERLEIALWEQRIRKLAEEAPGLVERNESPTPKAQEDFRRLRADIRRSWQYWQPDTLPIIFPYWMQHSGLFNRDDAVISRYVAEILPALPLLDEMFPEEDTSADGTLNGTVMVALWNAGPARLFGAQRAASNQARAAVIPPLEQWGLAALGVQVLSPALALGNPVELGLWWVGASLFFGVLWHIDRLISVWNPQTRQWSWKLYPAGVPLVSFFTLYGALSILAYAVSGPQFWPAAFFVLSAAQVLYDKQVLRRPDRLVSSLTLRAPGNPSIPSDGKKDHSQTRRQVAGFFRDLADRPAVPVLDGLRRGPLSLETEIWLNQQAQDVLLPEIAQTLSAVQKESKFLNLLASQLVLLGHDMKTVAGTIKKLAESLGFQQGAFNPSVLSGVQEKRRLALASSQAAAQDVNVGLMLVVADDLVEEIQEGSGEISPAARRTWLGLESVAGRWDGSDMGEILLASPTQGDVRSALLRFARAAGASDKLKDYIEGVEIRPWAGPATLDLEGLRDRARMEHGQPKMDVGFAVSQPDRLPPDWKSVDGIVIFLLDDNGALWNPLEALRQLLHAAQEAADDA